MPEFKPGDQLRAVDEWKQDPPRDAVVSELITGEKTGDQYVLAVYKTDGRAEVFDAGTGFRAWDAENRWRLEPVPAAPVEAEAEAEAATATPADDLVTPQAALD